MSFTSPFTGQVETRYIKEREGIHCAVRISFEATSIIDRTAIIDSMSKVSDTQRSKADKICAEALARRLQSWDFLDADGNSFKDGVPGPTVDTILKLKPELFQRISLIVLYGTDGGDPDPSGSKAGKTVNEAIEDQQKN
jgi:hypothetical protein